MIPRKESLSHWNNRNDFLEFIKTDKHYNKYYDAVYILFIQGFVYQNSVD